MQLIDGDAVARRRRRAATSAPCGGRRHGAGPGCGAGAAGHGLRREAPERRPASTATTRGRLGLRRDQRVVLHLDDHPERRLAAAQREAALSRRRAARAARRRERRRLGELAAPVVVLGDPRIAPVGDHRHRARPGGHAAGMSKKYSSKKTIGSPGRAQAREGAGERGVVAVVAQSRPSRPRRGTGRRRRRTLATTAPAPADAGPAPRRQRRLGDQEGEREKDRHRVADRLRARQREEDDDDAEPDPHQLAPGAPIGVLVDRGRAGAHAPARATRAASGAARRRDRTTTTSRC